MIFAAVSGSGAATISAIGGITVPEMLKKGYSRGFTAAMSAGAGSLGPIVPPSVDMIVFGCITGFSISRLFVGGIIPGFIIGLSLMIYCYIYAKSATSTTAENSAARSFGLRLKTPSGRC